MSVFAKMALCCTVVALALLFSVANSCNNTFIDWLVTDIEENILEAITSTLPEDSSAYKPVSNQCSDYEEDFDYIIIGAGSAGSVIANRLSEDPNKKILLLEAGGNETAFSQIPLMMFYLQGLPLNWNYKSTPQTTCCLGMVDHQCAYPRGKGKGGSSMINAGMYVRGNKKDFDDWASQGNPGWSYKDVLPYFKKSENCHIVGVDPGYHGTGGLLNVNYTYPPSPQLEAFIEANNELGREYVDYNGKQQLGVSRTQFNVIHGKRDSAGKAFLRPVLNRPNLKILTEALVTKILINPLTRKATGVLFSQKRKCFKAKATREVILSAGAINSPQLLMLSGIGPFLHLTTLGIPVVQHLAVGENLQDHATYYALHFVTNYTHPYQSLEELVEEYACDGVGDLTIAGNAQGVAFIQTKGETRPDYPDIEFVMLPSNNTNDYLQKAFRYTNESYQSIWAKLDPSRSITIAVNVLHPKSRGNVRLKSKSPYDFPLIDLKLLSDPRDVETMYQGIKSALELVSNTNAFKKLNATHFVASLPACKSYEKLTKQYWVCLIRQLTTHLYHPIGTCKMGPNPLKGAVVNHELKVYGIRNLRVADASVIPDATSGHTGAAAMMIGEKAADLIKSEW